MKSIWQIAVTNILTAAYLISAGVITIATSKSSDYNGTQANWAVAGITNYSVRSNCTSAAYNIDAIRVENGVIRQSIGTDGVVRTTDITDFMQLGFAQSSLIVGADQTPLTTDATNTRKCLVRARQSVAYSGSTSTTGYNFLQPGSLTTVQYDCYVSSNYQCSITLSELPAGDLSQVY